MRSIEFRLRKFEPRGYEEVLEMNTLFDISPNGIIIFNEHLVLRANKSIKTLLKIEKQKYIPIRIVDLFENSSLLKIKNWIQQSLRGSDNVFNDMITIKNALGEELKMNLVISRFSNYSDFVQFIGFFTKIAPVNISLVNDQLSNQVCNLLKRENMIITHDLEEKITNLINKKTVKYNTQDNSFFTKRENQVLSLSMEGLPVKVIADKLSISQRTVEKYRTKLMKKSKANNIVEVIVFSLKNGLIKI